MNGASLEVNFLVGGYGNVTVVHGVSFRALAGQITALIGSNGAGKSTTLRMLSGLLPMASGRIQLDGCSISDFSAHQRVDDGLVMVPEGRMIFPHMTVEENLRIGAFAPRARLGIADRMTEAYDLFPLLAERRRQLGGTLSGGEQQMLALARGLMALPRLLLLDEPSLGLAPQAAAEIFDIIEKLSSKGLTIVLAEQDIYRSLMLAHQAYVFEHGRISLEGSGNDLMTDPRIRVAYLGIEPAKL